MKEQMKRPNRKDYINKKTKVQLIADLELHIDYLEKELADHLTAEQELTVREVLEWMNNSKKDCYLFEMYKDGSGEIDNEQNVTHTMFGSLDELTKIIRRETNTPEKKEQ